MGIVKAFFLAIVVVSMALPPVAAAEMHGQSSHEQSAAAHSECCPPGQECDEPAKGDCGHDAACALKCAPSVSPVLVTPASLTPKRLTLRRTNLLVESATARSINPPLPPPRI
jgi:hypothetical protein